MRTILSGGVLFLALSVSAQDTAPKAPNDDHLRGTLCVLPNSSEPPRLISPGGAYNPATLKVRLDSGKPVLWPHKKTLKMEGISAEGRHLLVLTSDGKPIQSVHFRFSKFKNAKVCVFFDGYQGIQLADEDSARWCKCK